MKYIITIISIVAFIATILFATKSSAKGRWETYNFYPQNVIRITHSINNYWVLYDDPDCYEDVIQIQMDESTYNKLQECLAKLKTIELYGNEYTQLLKEYPFKIKYHRYKIKYCRDKYLLHYPKDKK